MNGVSSVAAVVGIIVVGLAMGAVGFYAATIIYQTQPTALTTTQTATQTTTQSITKTSLQTVPVTLTRSTTATVSLTESAVSTETVSTTSTQTIVSVSTSVTSVTPAPENVTLAFSGVVGQYTYSVQSGIWSTSGGGAGDHSFPLAGLLQGEPVTITAATTGPGGCTVGEQFTMSLWVNGAVVAQSSSFCTGSPASITYVV